MSQYSTVDFRAPNPSKLSNRVSEELVAQPIDPQSLASPQPLIDPRPLVDPQPLIDSQFVTMGATTSGAAISGAAISGAAISGAAKPVKMLQGHDIDFVDDFIDMLQLPLKFTEELKATVFRKLDSTLLPDIAPKTRIIEVARSAICDKFLAIKCLPCMTPSKWKRLLLTSLEGDSLDRDYLLGISLMAQVTSQYLEAVPDETRRVLSRRIDSIEKREYNALSAMTSKFLSVLMSM